MEIGNQRCKKGWVKDVLSADRWSELPEFGEQADQRRHDRSLLRRPSRPNRCPCRLSIWDGVLAAFTIRTVAQVLGARAASGFFTQGPAVVH